MHEASPNVDAPCTKCLKMLEFWWTHQDLNLGPLACDLEGRRDLHVKAAPGRRCGRWALAQRPQRLQQIRGQWGLELDSPAGGRVQLQGGQMQPEAARRQHRCRRAAVQFIPGKRMADARQMHSNLMAAA